MSGWDGTGDQYHADVDSRYPLFSDMQTTDYSITTVPKPIRPRQAHSYESKYQYEQQDIPATLGCNCGACPMREWPRGSPPLRKLSIDEREAIMQLQHDAIFGRTNNFIAAPVRASGAALEVSPTHAIMNQQGIHLDNNMIVLLFIFIIVIIVCGACMKSIGELRASLEKLMNR